MVVGVCGVGLVVLGVRGGGVGLVVLVLGVHGGVGLVVV